MAECLTQVRVRLNREAARIEGGLSEIVMLTEEARRSRIVATFKDLGFQTITVDFEGYRVGGGN